MGGRKHYHVYVIELDPAVMNKRRFARENRHYDGTGRCFYVGMTGKTPLERLKQHREGIKSCKYAHEFGKWLRPNLYKHLNPMNYEDACIQEEDLADHLRRQGHAVWQR